MDVQLRGPLDDDLPILFRHQLDPEASAMAAFPSRDWEAFAAHQARIQADETVLSRTIVVDGTVAGGIGSWQAKDERDVGYWIGREFWGRGIATAALRSFLEIETTRPLLAHVAAHNVGSRRVLDKCGFEIVRAQHVDEVDELVMRLSTAAAGA
jgi:RimJ/RimL family protein N-acetyltransferase